MKKIPCLLLAVPLAAAAQAPFTEIEAGIGRDHLSGGRAAWTSEYLEGAHTFAPRQTLYGGVRRTKRFGLRDSEVSAGYYHPLGATLTGLVEGSYSSEHNVLPQNSVLGQLSWTASPGWVLSGGLRHGRYTRSDTNLLLAGVERYWSDFRAGYTLYNGRPEGAGSASAHRLTFDYFYGERSRVGVGLTKGRELENVGPPIGVTSTDVRSLGLYGRHWVTPAWAFTYDLVSQEQGSLYRRQVLRLGLRYSF